MVERRDEKSAKIASDSLDIRLNLEENPEEKESSSSLNIDLTPFHRPPQGSNFQAECGPLKVMLEQGHRELIRHPVTETFIRVKWQKLRKFFLFGLVYNLLLAVAISVSTVASNNQRSFKQEARITTISSIGNKNQWFSEDFRIISGWVVVALLIPFALKIALDIAVQRGKFFAKGFHSFTFNIGKKRTVKIAWPPSFRACLVIVMLATTLAHVFLDEKSSHRNHFTCWSVLTAWINVLVTVRDCPCLGIHVFALNVVLKDVLKFILATFSLFLGFSFAFYSLLQLSNPISAVFSTISMTYGRFQDFGSDQIFLAGTSQIILLLFLVVVAITMVNVLVGIAVANVGDVLKHREDFRIGQMILNICSIEEYLLLIINSLKKCSCCCKNLHKCVTLLSDEEECVFKIYKSQDSSRKRRRFLPLENKAEVNQPVFILSSNSDPIQTPWTLPSTIWQRSKSNLDEQNSSKDEDDDEDPYASMYWPDKSDDGAYEPVDSNMSMMKELRRDLARLLRLGGGTNRSRRGKSVNVRPGLALGVMTLQAGSKGPKLLLE